MNQPNAPEPEFYLTTTSIWRVSYCTELWTQTNVQENRTHYPDANVLNIMQQLSKDVNNWKKINRECKFTIECTVDKLSLEWMYSSWNRRFQIRNKSIVFAYSQSSAKNTFAVECWAYTNSYHSQNQRCPNNCQWPFVQSNSTEKASIDWLKSTAKV